MTLPLIIFGVLFGAYAYFFRPSWLGLLGRRVRAQGTQSGQVLALSGGLQADGATTVAAATGTKTVAVLMFNFSNDTSQPWTSAYAQGVVVNLTNPKTIVFVFAFIPQFVDPHARHVWLQVLVLGLSFACLGFLSDSVYALVAGTVADRLRGSAGIVRFERWFGGGVLVGLGIVAAVWTPHRAH